MKTRIIYLVLLFFVFLGLNNAICQMVGDEIIATPDYLKKVIEPGKISTVAILSKDEKLIVGTGVLTLGTSTLFLVTNYHVIKKGYIGDVANEQEENKRLNELKGKDEIKVRLNLPEGVEVRNTRVIKSDKENDVIVLVFPKKDEADIWKSTNKAINEVWYPEESDFFEGKTIIFIGFPLGIGKEYQNQPVSRSGMIAQVVPKRNAFLIDAIANPGNSGSPIFGIVKDKIKFMGIIKGYRQDYIIAEDKENLAYIQLPYNSGMTIAVSSLFIKGMLLDAERDLEQLAPK